MSSGSRRPAKKLGTWGLLALLTVSARMAACRDYATDEASHGRGGEAAGGRSTAGAEAGSDLRGGAGENLPGAGASLGGASAGLPHDIPGGFAGMAGDANAPLAGTGGQPFEPTSPADFKGKGLVLWFGADACSYDQDSRVSQCADGSGFGNRALQPTPASRPLFVENSLNGHPTLRFDGGAAVPSAYVPSVLRIEDSESLHFGTDDFAVIVVARYENSPTVAYTLNGGFATVQYGGYGGIIAKVEPISPYSGLSLFANYPLGNVTMPALRRVVAQLELGTSFTLSASINLNDNHYRVYTAHRFDKRWLELRINGHNNGLSQMAADIDASAVNQPVFVGGGAGQPLRGDIAELAWIKGPTSEQQLSQLELTLVAKYAL